MELDFVNQFNALLARVKKLEERLDNVEITQDATEELDLDDRVRELETRL